MDFMNYLLCYTDEEECNRLQNTANAVMLSLSLLTAVVGHPSYRLIQDEYFDVFMEPLRDVLRDVAEEFRILRKEDQPPEETFVYVSGEVAVSNMMKLKLIKKDMKRVSCVIYEASRSKKTATASIVSPAGLLGFIDFILLKLDTMLSLALDLAVPVKEQIKALGDELEFLRYFLWFITRSKFQKMNFYRAVEALAVKAACLLYLCLVDDDTTVPEMKNELLNLIARIELFQHKIHGIYLNTRKHLVSLSGFHYRPIFDDLPLVFIDYLIHYLKMHLSDKSGSFILAVRDRAEILIEELSFLRYNATDPELAKCIYPKLVSDTEAVFMDTGYLIYLSRDHNRDKEMAEEVLDRLFLHVELIKKTIMDDYDRYIPKFWRSNYPSTDELGSVDLIIENLNELLQYRAASIRGLKGPIETVFKDIASTRKRFTEVAELCNDEKNVKVLLTRLKDVTYHFELAVDLLVSGHNFSDFAHCLHYIALEVKIIGQEVKAIMKMTCETIVDKVPQASGHVSSQARNLSNIDAVVGSNDQGEKKAEEGTTRVVGLQDAAEEVLERLISETTPLKIVSIVGMPGLGKTTFANLLYHHPSVNNHFHIRAWCIMSQAYQKMTLLSRIFFQIVGETNQNPDIHGEDIVEKLYKSLKGMRYLIVIDDIWDIEAWKDIKESFPDDCNGSRIIFTTRNSPVALEANSIPYALYLLSVNESHELLHWMLFEEETCPPQLEIITRRIAENCKGLPLAVVLVAGVLKRTERKKDSWEQVAKTLSWSHEVEGILEFSYKILPDYLKPCFLYLGAFEEDSTISASKLVQLWISEGFVNSGKNSLEQEAKNYLKDLIDRSLVMIAERSSRGGVKACLIHDLLRDFCLAKAEKEKFLLHEGRYHRFHISQNDSYESKHLEEFRLCISSMGNPYIAAGYNPPRVRSLLYYCKSNRSLAVQAGYDPSTTVIYDQYPNQPIMLQYLRLLRVLDLGNVHFQSGANTSDLVHISSLVCLKYLAIRVCTNEIPSDLGNLQNLETFILTGDVGEVILPEVIWSLPRLRHVNFLPTVFFRFQKYSEEFFENSYQLHNLRTISLASLYYGNDEKFLRRLPNLQKLGCIFSDSWDDSTKCNHFPVLDFLTQLESLKVFFSSEVLNRPCKFIFPSNLKKLTMSNFRLPWDEISVIGRMLPNLEVLKLVNNAFEGTEWCMKEGEFQKLKFLKLSLLDLEVWDAEVEHLPVLEQLVVVRCQHLKEIPSSIGEILTLQSIGMIWCSSSANDSVKQIFEYQRDLSNDQLKVYVVGPESDLASSL